MNNPDQERWPRVKERLRAEVGEDIFSSWFARMELESIDGDTVRLSVPTRFLKSWVQSHYADKLLACWQAELPAIRRIDLGCARRCSRTLPPKAKPAETSRSARDLRDDRGLWRGAAPLSAAPRGGA